MTLNRTTASGPQDASENATYRPYCYARIAIGTPIATVFNELGWSRPERRKGYPVLSSFVPTRRLHQLPTPQDGLEPLTRPQPPEARQRGLVKDLKTPVKFVDVYCRHQHPGVLKREVAMKHLDVTTLMGRPIHLCPSCTRLVTHAMIKRTSCPL